MILLIDNYDSFVFNLARYFQRLGHETEVIRSDAIDVRGVAALQPAAVVLSPGPCTPREAGCSVEVVRELSATVPMLGVCLGHQAIGAALGGTVVRAPEPWHGRTSQVLHDGTGIFSGIPGPVTVCRYHSLVLDEATLPAELRVTGRTAGGIVMAIAHATRSLIGLQFHPEAILTDSGFLMLANFLRIAGLDAKSPLPHRGGVGRSTVPRGAGFATSIHVLLVIRIRRSRDSAMPLILEGIVTTLGADGQLNVAPMGPIVDRAVTHLTLRPFPSSQTCQNLRSNPHGVFHVVDDVELLARAAIDQLMEIPATIDCGAVPGKILRDACQWHAFRVTEVDPSHERVRMECEVVESGVLRKFFGFNRAKHAVLEGAILATRIGILPAAEIREQFDRLAVIVDKTAGDQEHRAWALLREYVERLH